MSDIWLLVLGWLFGLLSPGIAERIRRHHREVDLLNSVEGELRDLRYLLCSVAYHLRSHVGEVTDQFVDWLEPRMRSYEGPYASPTLADNLVRVRSVPESQRRETHLAQTAGHGTNLKEFYVPFLDAQQAELSICSLEFQRHVFRVKRDLDAFNQDVRMLKDQYALTFQPAVMEASGDVVRRNLTGGYLHLATLAERLVATIELTIHRAEVERRSWKARVRQRRTAGMASELTGGS